MTPRESIARLMEEQGRTVYLLTAGPGVHCFLQPMRYKNKMYLDSQYARVGVVDESCFLYLGPPDCDLPEGASPVLWDEAGEGYTCVKQEIVRFGRLPVYTWAILRKEESA
ncbi:MAG: hypothetical protein J6X61_02710 [Clostridia bacterium]|nr:hypothetical protein [Clostridia bacterium]